MIRRLSISLCVVAIATTAAAAERSRYIVATRTAPRAARMSLVDDAAAARERSVRTFESIDGFAADLTDAEAAQLRLAPGVRWVRRVVARQIADAAPGFATAPNAAPLEESQSLPWGIDVVNAPRLWPITRGLGKVNVAIFDTGVDATHPDVGPNVVGGYNVLTQRNEILDDNGHGTHVAGTIAALDNGFGVVGVAHEARLWAVKVLDKNGNGTDENVVAGVDKVLSWKHDLGGQWIISLSIGAIDPSDAEREAFHRLADNDVLAVAAAGNRGLPGLEYPAGYPDVLAVGAIDSDKSLASFSSYGPGISVVAPGVKVLSAAPRGSVVTAGARIDGQQTWYTGFAFIGSPRNELHGSYAACGLGHEGEFPPEVRGKIALIARGEITFAEKVRHAVDAGAIGAMIYTYDDNEAQNPGTLYRPDCSDPDKGCVPWPDDVAFPWPPTVGLPRSAGLALLAQNGGAVTIGTWVTDYRSLSGTSMATPHVTGIAALLWTLRPTAPAIEIRAAITGSAHDLGPAGYDIQYGFGLVDAFAAAKLLAPDLTPPPQPPPPRRRATH